MGWFDDVSNSIQTVDPYARAQHWIDDQFNEGRGGTDNRNMWNSITGSKDANGNPVSAPGGSASSAVQRQNDMDAGYAKGKEIFYDDPEMAKLKTTREEMAKGYDGAELGAMRATARGEVAGQRDNDQRRLASNLARGGVGGARAAAMRGSADQKYSAVNADNERKMALESANMKRTGTDSLQDFMFRQKYGMLGTGIGYGQLGVADRSADAQLAAANKPEEKKGFFNF